MQIVYTQLYSLIILCTVYITSVCIIERCSRVLCTMLGYTVLDLLDSLKAMLDENGQNGSLFDVRKPVLHNNLVVLMGS